MGLAQCVPHRRWNAGGEVELAVRDDEVGAAADDQQGRAAAIQFGHGLGELLCGRALVNRGRGAADAQRGQGGE